MNSVYPVWHHSVLPSSMEAQLEAGNTLTNHVIKTNPQANYAAALPNELTLRRAVFPHLYAGHFN
jgi:hypothetical protein